MTLVSGYDTQIYISSQSTTHIFTCRFRSKTQIHVSVSAHNTDSHVGLRVRHNFTRQSCHTHIYMSVSEYDRQIYMSAYRQSTAYRFTCWRTDRARHTDLHVGVPTEYDIQICMLAYRQSTTYRFTCWRADRVRHTDLHVGVPTKYDTQIYSSVSLYNSYIYIAASSTYETHNYLQGATHRHVHCTRGPKRTTQSCLQINPRVLHTDTCILYVSLRIRHIDL